MRERRDVGKALDQPDASTSSLRFDVTIVWEQRSTRESNFHRARGPVSTTHEKSPQRHTQISGFEFDSRSARGGNRDAPLHCELDRTSGGRDSGPGQGAGCLDLTSGSDRQSYAACTPSQNALADGRAGKRTNATAAAAAAAQEITKLSLPEVPSASQLRPDHHGPKLWLKEAFDLGLMHRRNRKCQDLIEEAFVNQGRLCAVSWSAKRGTLHRSCTVHTPDPSIWGIEFISTVPSVPIIRSFCHSSR